MSPEFPQHPFRTRGGIRLPAHKTTLREKTVTMPAPDICVIPLRQSAGASCRALVKKGDHVYRGQKIGDTEEVFAVPVHASISGTVLKIEETELSSGEICEAVYIESDGRMESLPDLQAARILLTRLWLFRLPKVSPESREFPLKSSKNT